MKYTNCWKSTVAFVCLNLVAGSNIDTVAKANTVAYNLSGTVKAIHSDNAGFSHAGAIHTGDAFSGLMTLDLAGSFAWSDPTGTYYNQPSPSAGYSLNVNGLSFHAIPGTSGIADIHPNWSPGEDMFEYETNRSVAMPAGYGSNVVPLGYFYLYSLHDTVFHDQQLAHFPTVSFNQFSQIDLYLAFFDPAVAPVVLTFPDGSSIVAPQWFEIDFSVTSLALASEPTSAALAALGFLGLAAGAWRRKRAQVLC